MNPNASIVIDTLAEPEYLQLILDTLPYMKGWKRGCNVTNSPHIKAAMYFEFDLQDKVFYWSHTNSTPPIDPPLMIRNIAHLSELLEFINGLGDAFVNCPEPCPQFNSAYFINDKWDYYKWPCFSKNELPIPQ